MTTRVGRGTDGRYGGLSWRRGDPGESRRKDLEEKHGSRYEEFGIPGEFSGSPITILDRGRDVGPLRGL